MNYKLEFSNRAFKQFSKLNQQTQKRISIQLDKLIQNPFMTGAKKLSGEDAIYRIRVGDYRVLYQIDHGKLVILVVDVGHRRKIYR